MFQPEDTSSEITVSAVWHGFNPEAKRCLLSAIARSSRVSRFSLIGPAARDYGKPEAVIDFVKGNCGTTLELSSATTKPTSPGRARTNAS